MKAHVVPFRMMNNFMVIRVSEMVETAFRIKQTPKKSTSCNIHNTS